MRVCWAHWVFIAVVALLFVSSLLAGCGKTGDLYLPDEPTGQQVEQATPPKPDNQAPEATE